mmetsp:Transcript_6382/g.12319  ORF Transcript_6382/g.12319 Transcript_6382/m.12319 type:complete len:100 (-) Transcript_6382:362-661(-)
METRKLDLPTTPDGTAGMRIKLCGVALTVMCSPQYTNNIESTIVTTGPLRAMSIKCVLVFGKDRSEVLQPSVPKRSEGRGIGGARSIPQRIAIRYLAAS